MLEVLEESQLPVEELIPAASEKSKGKKVRFSGKEWEVVTVQEALEKRPQAALFSAGGEISKEWAPKFAEAGITVIDNSSAWRMDPNVKLVVPEINAHTLTPEDKIIANPNCSTIQLVMVLNPLNRWGLKRVLISTYQSVTGSGQRALDQMQQERSGSKEVQRLYPHQIDQNVIPQCDVFTDNGYTKEEMKLVNETRKILNLPTLPVSATAVRVPVVGGHSESVNVELEREAPLEEVVEALQQSYGVVVEDDTAQNKYPMPASAHDTNDVYVGRIRKDLSHPNALNLWIVADNLRKGAATNAVQILGVLQKSGMLRK